MEFHLKHGCVWELPCVMLSCAVWNLAVGQSTIQAKWCSVLMQAGSTEGKIWSVRGIPQYLRLPGSKQDEFSYKHCHYVNIFTAIVNLSRFNNSCLKSPALTLVDLIFESRSFSLNQLTCHYRRETCTAASVYLTDVIFNCFIVYYAYIVI